MSQSLLARQLLQLGERTGRVYRTNPEKKVTNYGEAFLCPTEQHRHDTEAEARRCAEQYHGRKVGLCGPNPAA